jgi:uncharacterized protein YjbI with pentapeptide repeats
MLPRAVVRAAAFTGLMALTAATPALGAGSASASSTARPSLPCPAVSSTGVVTPAPAPGINWNGCDLEHANLADADLNGADLGAADLGSADLTGADLASASLNGARLLQATLTGADLTGTSLTAAVLTSVTSGGIVGTPSSFPPGWQLLNGFLVGPEANLSGADLSGADLSGVNLNRSNLTDANLAGTDLSGASLNFVPLTGANLTNTNLANASLAEAISGGVTGQPAALPDHWMLVSGFLIGPFANLSHASLSGADLDGADLLQADLTSADLSDAQLRNADMRQADLETANLTDADATNADLSTARLSAAKLVSAQLSTADISSANISLADLTGADLMNANLTTSNLSNASLRNANLTGAVLDEVIWDNTTCPDGSSSNQHVSGCVSPLDTTPPVAHPAATQGTAGNHGWFISPIVVSWNWTDNGSISAADCPASTPASLSGMQVLSATCSDEAGNQGSARFQAKIDTSHPAVSLTGLRSRQVYRIGHVPTGHCSTTDQVSGVQTPARLKITPNPTQGVGVFLAACSGAISVAGQHPAAPVQVIYEVAYGLRTFISPRPHSTIPRRHSSVDVIFQLAGANGRPLSSTLAQQLAARQQVQVRLTGPAISPQTASCRWIRSKAHFTCTLDIPRGVRTHRNYHIAVREHTGRYVQVLSTSTARNPEIVRFR